MGYEVDNEGPVTSDEYSKKAKARAKELHDGKSWDRLDWPIVVGILCAWLERKDMEIGDLKTKIARMEEENERTNAAQKADGENLHGRPAPEDFAESD